MSASRIPIKGLAPEVEAMLQEDGLYLAGDAKNPRIVIPMMSMGGKIFTLVKDVEIDPMRFLPTMRLSGPFVPTPDASR